MLASFVLNRERLKGEEVLARTNKLAIGSYSAERHMSYHLMVLMSPVMHSGGVTIAIDFQQVLSQESTRHVQYLHLLMARHETLRAVLKELHTYLDRCAGALAMSDETCR